jgi:excisionase family DNA binding protein
VRFLTLDQVAEELATSRSQMYALVRSGQLEGIKIGGRGQWRVERVKLEEWIAGRYEEMRQLRDRGQLPEDDEE